MKKLFIFTAVAAALYTCVYMYDSYSLDMARIRRDKEELQRKNENLTTHLVRVIGQLDTLKEVAAGWQQADMATLSAVLKKSVYKIIVWKKKTGEEDRSMVDSVDNISNHSVYEAHAGTAFCFLQDDILLTNYHVIGDDAGHVIVVDPDNREVVVTQILLADEKLDYAVLRAPDLYGTPLHPADMAIEEGVQVVTMGNPLEMDFTPSMGWITALRLQGNVLQIDNPITFGNSGGPLVDVRGNLLGLVFGGYRSNAMLNFAVNIHAVVRDIEEKGNVRIMKNVQPPVALRCSVYEVAGKDSANTPEAAKVPSYQIKDLTDIPRVAYGKNVLEQ